MLLLLFLEKDCPKLTVSIVNMSIAFTTKHGTREYLLIERNIKNNVATAP